MKLLLKKIIALFHRWPEPFNGFDREWYLTQYPDVAIAGAEPWHHYVRFGWREGRIPAEPYARLWAENDTEILVELNTQLASGNAWMRQNAAWMLGRWYANLGDWLRVRDCLHDEIDNKSIHNLPIGMRLLWLDADMRVGLIEQADTAVLKWCVGDSYPHDYDLVRANAHQRRSRKAEWLSSVNAVYEKEGLLPIRFIGFHDDVFRLDDLSASIVKGLQQIHAPLVSVIIPAHNAAETLTTTLRCLQEQTWGSLEIIVVDDGSNDNTVAIAKYSAQSDVRIQVHALSSNLGAYAARNEGLRLAKGDFITVHDSDDWSHPQKVERQVQALIDSPRIMATISHWVRATTDLYFGGWNTPSSWPGWIHRNTSSLMIRRNVVDELGYWDTVKCSADLEYYYRLIHAYGHDALKEVLPGIPLAIGRSHSGSLTQSSETSIFSIFGGLRKRYHEASNLWHYSALEPKDLYMPYKAESRPFPVREEMLVMLTFDETSITSIYNDK